MKTGHNRLDQTSADSHAKRRGSQTLQKPLKSQVSNPDNSDAHDEPINNYDALSDESAWEITSTVSSIWSTETYQDWVTQPAEGQLISPSHLQPSPAPATTTMTATPSSPTHGLQQQLHHDSKIDMKFDHDEQNLVTIKDEIIFEDTIKEESNWEDTWSLEDIPVDLQSDVDLDDFDSIDQSPSIPQAQSSCGPSCSPIPSTSKAAYARENCIEVQS